MQQPLEEAKFLFEQKCATEGCWHRCAWHYIYCVCCLHDRCTPFTEEEIAVYQQYEKEQLAKHNGQS